MSQALTPFQTRVLGAVRPTTAPVLPTGVEATYADRIATALSTSSGAATKALRALVAAGLVVEVPLRGLTVPGFRLARDERIAR